MKKHLKHFSIVSILVLSLGVLATGCSSDTRKPNNENVPHMREGMDVDQDNDLTGDRNIRKGTVEPGSDGLRSDDLDDNDLVRIEDNESMTKRSKSISEKLSKLDGINNPNVVITGKTALVGVDLATNTEDSKTTELKNMVQSKVKEIDSDIDNVVVTSDMDLTKRIKNVGKDIEDGKPISGLLEEIEEVMRRITPNM